MHTVDQARDFARACLDGLEPRWSHVQAVGRLAEDLIEHHGMSEVVAVAAWLHDVGYGEALVVTGFHPLDGANRLRGEWGDEIVGVVAWHTGAAFEAKERGLWRALDRLPKPNARQLELLTMIDLSVSPTGELISPADRINEILGRYSEDNPVHRAVTRSGKSLLGSAARGRAQLGLPDEWPLTPAEACSILSRMDG